MAFKARPTPIDYPLDRIIFHIDGPDECWIWDKAKDPNGYGRLNFRGDTFLAHRLSYESIRGPIGSELSLDHLCRRPSCINPWHLEPVTHRINMLRGNTLAARMSAKTHCFRGHEFTDANTECYRGGRRCRECAKIIRYSENYGQNKTLRKRGRG